MRDLKCWIKNDQSSLPELVKIKAIERCLLTIIRVVNTLWKSYEEADDKGAVLTIIEKSVFFIDWLCERGEHHYLFNKEHGKQLIGFYIDRTINVLTHYKLNSTLGDRTPVEDLIHGPNHKGGKETKKYDAFPFNKIGCILLNTLFKLLRADDPLLNELLCEANFGIKFGEILMLEYDFLRHCIDHNIEGLVLVDTFVKKNEIRLNMFQEFLKTSEPELRNQFIESGVIEIICRDYISDFREMNVSFNKIDLDFLAFRKSHPLRMEAISFVNTIF